MKLIRLPLSALKISGQGACDFLHSVCTNDVKGLKPGEGMGAAFLDRFGKVIAISSIHNMNGHYFIISDAAAHKPLMEHLKPSPLDKCVVEDLSGTHISFSSIWCAKRGEIIEGEFSGVKTIEMGNCFIDRSDFLVPKEVAEDFWVLAHEKGTAEDYEAYMTGKGLPEHGKDYDGTYMVLELGLDNIISHTKGCYTGQEIVARMRAYGGEVPRKIVRVQGHVKKGEKLFMNGKEAGFVTSAAGGFGIATAKKGFFDKGTELMTEGGKVVVV
ncbi:MAG: hypothetical protein HYW27_03665 [Candidatus Aenigmarchaeota archaeon]|nr:hypothetical protein [Candidatus Aenigmarchaeota archaeon]